MRIIATGSAVPKQVITNDQLSEILDTSDEWITTRTGIKTRRILGEEKLEHLAAKAAMNALEQAGMSAGELDFIVCSNVYSDFMTPSMACVVQGKIGADCPAMDINGACAGFLYALFTAQGMLKSGCKRILVLCAESPVKMADWTDRATCVLFGDGAAAAIVSAEGEDIPIRLTAKSRTEVLYAYNPPSNCPYTSSQPQAHKLFMNGQEVYKFAVNAATHGISSLMEEKGITADDVDHFVLHQANLRIIEAVRMRMKQPKEKFPTNIENRGNSSSAGLPILLDELNRSGKLKKGDIIALSAFGAGLVSGAGLMEWTL